MLKHEKLVLILIFMLFWFCVWVGAKITEIPNATGGVMILGGGTPAATTAATTTITLQNFSDAFTTDPFTTRFGHLTTNVFTYTTGDITSSSSGQSACYYNVTQTSTQNQYVKFHYHGTSGNWAIVLRSTGTGSAGYYVVASYNNDVWFAKWAGSGWASDIQDLSNITITENENVGATICGTGASTVARIWENPTNNTPVSCTGWDTSGDTADITSSTDPGATYYTGGYVGLGCEIAAANEFDDFFGGDVP